MSRKKRKRNKGPRGSSVASVNPVLRVTPSPADTPEKGLEETTQIPDYRSELLTWCAEAAKRGISEMNFPRREGPQRKKCSSLLFDLLNGEVSPFDGSGEAAPMPLYVLASGKTFRCSPQGLYREPLVGCYEYFCEENREETEYLRQSILYDSIRDCATGEDVHPGFGLMCLTPDTADAFDRSFRSQLEYQGALLFQVPRSIALAYTLRSQGRKLRSEFLCVDYDGEEAHAIRIRETEGDGGNGERLFVRMGRERISEGHLSYRKLAKEYLRLYQKKYRQTLTPEAVSNLVDTKLLQRLLQNPEEQILVSSGEDVASIRPDKEILEQLSRQVAQDLGQISAEKQLPSYGLCAFLPADGNQFFRLEQLEQGGLEIRKRAEAKKILWQEYLPPLELEVNRDGVFASIELIGEAHRKQNISFMLEEKVEIPVSNGIVIFPAKGESQYDLPLTRDVYGSHSKEKLARFCLQKPLKQDIEVELTVHYCYGDIDSYKLTARSPKLDEPLESEWYDAKQLPNLAPVFRVDQAQKHFLSHSESKEMYDAFQKFADDVCADRRPSGKMTYFRKGNWYSEYLSRLNKGGWPYFQVQNFFQKDAPWIEEYIRELTYNAVFQCMADVLNRDLPNSKHNLDRVVSEINMTDRQVL